MSVSRTMFLFWCTLAATPAWAEPPRTPPRTAEEAAARKAEREARLAELQAREAQILAEVKEAAPQEHAALLALKTEDPRAYWQTLRRMDAVGRTGDTDAYGDVLRMRQLEDQLAALAEGYDALPKAEQTKRRAQCETLATELFALRQEARRRKVAHLEERLAVLRAEIDEREAKKETLIDAFVDQLLVGPADL